MGANWTKYLKSDIIRTRGISNITIKTKGGGKIWATWALTHLWRFISPDGMQAQKPARRGTGASTDICAISTVAQREKMAVKCSTATLQSILHTHCRTTRTTKIAVEGGKKQRTPKTWLLRLSGVFNTPKIIGRVFQTKGKTTQSLLVLLLCSLIRKRSKRTRTLGCGISSGF